MHSRNQGGFTLVELVLVIAILTMILLAAATRVGQITGWRYNSDLRRFVNTWQFLFQEAVARREAYRLIVNLDEQTYVVVREIPADDGETKNVDRVSKFRSREEQARRDARKRDREERMAKLHKDYENEDIRQSNTLESLFFQFTLSDADGAVELTTPLEFPSLAEPVQFSPGLKIRDVVIGNTEVTSGEVQLRLAPTGSSDFAVVHFEVNDELFTATVNPATGEPTLVSGESSFDWNVNQST